MRSSKDKRRSLRRQWSVDVPSSIQKKLHKVVSRSKSLDDKFSRQLLLDEESDKKPTCKYGNGSYENLGLGDGHEEEYCSSSPTCSDSSSKVDENAACSWQKIDDIRIELDDDEEEFEKSILLSSDKVENKQNTLGLLSTIDEAPPRSPTKRTSQHTFDGDVNKEKYEINDVPRKFARNDVSGVDADTDNIESEGGTITDRHRRHAICEEMEKYIIVDARGHNLRKYRETLVRHRVLKELCLL